MSISILGAGAFGSALAQSISSNGPITLWARDEASAREMHKTRVNQRYLPGVKLSPQITVTSSMASACDAETLLLCVPAQALRKFLEENKTLLNGKTLVSCAKGIDLDKLTGTATMLQERFPAETIAMLSGPGFAGEIARGMPTALTLACVDPALGDRLQKQLSTPSLRLYLSDDTRGVEIGGALKNVVAIAAGIVIGGGYGESARAAIMTRGLAELRRLAITLGAKEETLFGLSGFGDLALTCTSDQSRNYDFGMEIGAGKQPDLNVTVEGFATAKAVDQLAVQHDLEFPVTRMVVNLLDGKRTVPDAVAELMSRPLRKE